jgi:hypothetical protein
VAIAAVIVAGVAGVVVALLRRSEPVRVTNVPTPSAAETVACRKLSAILPATIGDGLKSRTVHPSSPLLHAWGTPAAVLRCGVGYPPNYPSTGAGQIDGITWDSTDAKDAVIFTATGRVPRVSLAIPRNYQVSFDLLVSLSDALKKATTAG